MSGREAPAGPPARLLLADRDPALRRVLDLALETAQPRHFITEPGMGYRSESEQEAGAQ
jgi:hypothetical protein